MDETARIDDLMRRMLEGGGWHGPGLAQVLEGIDADDAAAHPIAGAHSIWEIVRHVIAWHEIAREALTGRWDPITPERDWPPLPARTEEAWKEDVARLRAAVAATREAISAMPPAALDLPLEGDPRQAPRALTLHGVVHHDAWHGGQIALLRRARLGAPAR
jgi:uncharacterized damage-inducible protein DinB